MPKRVLPKRVLSTFAVAALLATASCGAQAPAATPRPSESATSAATATLAAVSTRHHPATSPSRRHHHRASTRIDRLVAIARHRYALESHGGVAEHQASLTAHDPAVLAAVRSGNRTALQRALKAVTAQKARHVSRVRVLEHGRVIADSGVPFVVAPVQRVLRSHSGRTLAVLETSIQDELGFQRFMHRNYPVDVVIRGHGAAHVRSSLPAALRVHLPARGSVRIAGHRYAVRLIHERALGNEPVHIWILQRSGAAAA